MVNIFYLQLHPNLGRVVFLRSIPSPFMTKKGNAPFKEVISMFGEHKGI
jgi:hypothetical protein